MLVLADSLRRLGQEPLAVPWTVHLASGWSGSAAVRTFRIYAPPRDRSIRPVLSRLHNAILLTNPASASLTGPIEPERLAAGLAELALVHHVPISLGKEASSPRAAAGLDLPSRDDVPALFLPKGLAGGLDLGGTGMKACVTEKGVLLRTRSAPTWPDGLDPSERGIDSLVRRARDLLIDVAQGQTLASLGVGMASPMDVSGRVVELSTVMRERVGDTALFEDFAARVADGICAGPVAMFNDLVNLGRWRASQGARRLVRLQIGTSFGGCWIDANGDVSPVEMGRLVVDVGTDAIPHTYLPIRGAMKSYLSNYGIALHLGGLLGRTMDARTIGHELAHMLGGGDATEVAAAQETVRWMIDALCGVVSELHAILPGITEVECGGSMLVGALGRSVLEGVSSRASIRFTIPSRPGFDGAIAAAQAPRLTVSLRGLKRMERA